MQTFTVPGLSAAIVKDGKVVLAKGYGVRRMGGPAPVDARTKFGIASNTKLFTATALAILVEEGKVEWDKPVTNYLPAFAMSDPYVTHELTVRDLLVHRSGLGLGAGDLLWWPPSSYNRKEIARRIRYIRVQPHSGAGGDLLHWQYETFLARWRDRELRADAYATFSLNPDGTVERLKMVAASGEVDFSFDFQDLVLKPVSGSAPR